MRNTALGASKSTCSPAKRSVHAAATSGDGLTPAERRVLQQAANNEMLAAAVDKQQQALHAYTQKANRQKQSRKAQRKRQTTSSTFIDQPTTIAGPASLYRGGSLHGLANAPTSPSAGKEPPSLYPQGPMGADFAVKKGQGRSRARAASNVSMPAPLTRDASRNAGDAIDLAINTQRARAIPRAAFLDAAKRATLSEAEQAALIYRGHEQAMLQLYERLSSAVRAEAAAQRASMMEMYASSATGKLKKAGVLLLDMVAVPHGRLYNATVWRLSMPRTAKGNRSLPYHKFARGDAVLLSTQQDAPVPTTSTAASTTVARLEGLDDLESMSDEEDSVLMMSGYRSVQGTISQVTPDYIDVALATAASQVLAQLPPNSPLRVDRVLREVTTARQLRAIKILRDGYQGQTSAAQHVVRGVLYCLPSTRELATTPPPWTRDAEWMARANAALEKQTLNKSQRVAIRQALSSAFTLWQGPPGTGKTKTLLALMQVVCAAGLPDGQPLLATADTNAAVDNLVEGLVGCGIRVVRVGQPAKVRPSLVEYALEARAALTIDGSKGTALLRDADAAEARAANTTDEGQRTRAMTKAKQMREQARRLSDKAAVSVIKGAQVVVATCAGSAERRLQDITFPMVLVDEAGQATEPSTLVPITRGASCVVLAGDHKQLPPTVVSQQAIEQHLDITLFERVQAAGVQPLLLDIQYRSHPAIAVFSSHTFYDAKVRSMVDPALRPPPSGIDWPCPEFPLLFVDVQGKETRPRGLGSLLQLGEQAGGSGGSSYANVEEARVALGYVRTAVAHGDLESAAVLTPYSAQLRLLEEGWGKENQPNSPAEVTLSSIDGYQGREADLVVLSMVRCNDKKQLGFVADQRRLNVALTRAKRGLVVVGNAATLSADPTWARFIEWLTKKGVCR